jgi:TRAP-type uncharacterized transport system substrate-binding protein
MKLMKTYALLSALLLACMSPAFAQAPVCPKDKLIMGTGTASGTYAQMFVSLNSVCEMVCEERNTQGGYDSLFNIVNEKFDGGIVQTDLLEYLNRTEPRIKRNVRSLASLHGSQMHIFALATGLPRQVSKQVEKTIPKWGGMSSDKVLETVTETEYVPLRTITDLKGLKVAAWSSAVVTATVVDERLKLNLDIIEVKDRKQGLDMLRTGAVAAFMGMGGKPVDWVEGSEKAKAEVDKSMVMVSVGNDDITRLGAPYYGEQVTYRSLGANGVRTISVRNELVVRNIQRGPLVGAVVAFQECFKKSLEDIQSERGKHPSWSDVALETPLAWEAYTVPKK